MNELYLENLEIILKFRNPYLFFILRIDKGGKGTQNFISVGKNNVYEYIGRFENFPLFQSLYNNPKYTIEQTYFVNFVYIYIIAIINNSI